MKIYQAYRCYTDADPEAPENTGMVNLIFIGQSAPDITKLRKLDGKFGTNPSLLVDLAFKGFNNREQQKKEDAKDNAIFLSVALARR